MERFFSEFGIDWYVLAAQAINFGLLLAVLRIFLYGPIVGMLNKRRTEIEKTNQHVKDMDAKLENIEKLKEEVFQKARAESEKIVKSAEKSATEAGERIVAEARAEAQKAGVSEMKKLEMEREKIVQEAKREIGEIVALAVEKTVGEALDEKSHERLAKSAVEKIQQSK